MKIVILDTIHPELGTMLVSRGFACVDVSEFELDHALKELTDAEGLVFRSRVSVDASFLSDYPQLRFIGRVGSGVDHIDLQACADRGVDVLSSPEGNAPAVAEHTLGMLLSLLARITHSNLQIRSGTWARKPNYGTELGGKKIGIIGYGNTGSAFARLLTGFDSDILVYDKYKTGFGTDTVRECTMDELFEEAEVVSLHIPLNEDTQNLVDDTWIKSFKKSLVLVNTSRGECVQSEAVLKGLESGKITGACLDVIEYEAKDLSVPPLEQLPSAFHELVKDERVILTPHIAGLTHEAFRRLSAVMADKIIEKYA